MRKSSTVMGITGFLALVLAVLLPIRGLSFDPAGNSEINMGRELQYCQDCHDGTLPVRTHQDHPVGIDYREAQLRSKGRLKDPSLLDATLKLQNGQVVCTSCHDPDSQLRAKLVMRNTGSRLCFSCHNL
ncbi:MAG: cytochrome c3 family protein [Candidatus Binatia bacterium]